jgi:hypothetical protein
MPLTSFEELPADARVWVFGASDEIAGDVERAMLGDVDAWLSQWHAHGHPLTCARDWRDGRFLVVGVDQSTAGASGCSIDALFRILQGVERSTGSSLLGGGRVFYRDANDDVQCVDRATFAARARSGAIGGDTPVFDTTVTTAEAYRTRFERPMHESWHTQLV